MDAIEPEELREAASRLLADTVDRRAPWGKAAPQAIATAARDAAAPLEAAMGELGWYMLTVPEAQGGMGQGFAALAPIYEEMGRALAPVWLADTMAAVDVLMLDESGAALPLLERIAQGSARVLVAEVASTGPAISASLPMAVGALAATDLLLVPSDGRGPAVLVSCDQAGVAITPVEAWDRGRDYGAVVLDKAQAAPLACDGALALKTAQAHRHLALAWDCIGGTAQILAETIAYTSTRHQFGQPVGAFQALKHRAADHKVHLEVARALTRLASLAYASRGDAEGDGPSAGQDWQTLAAQARLLAGDAYAATAEDAVQMFGGVGFTWEYDCHLFLKRALASQTITQHPDRIRDDIALTIMRGF